MFQCYQCSLNLASLFAMNYNAFPYGQIQNPSMRIMQSTSLFEPSIQIPLIQKKNNNKNNKNTKKNKNDKNDTKNDKNQNKIK